MTTEPWKWQHQKHIPKTALARGQKYLQCWFLLQLTVFALFFSLSSAYKDVLNKEVNYTTWKYREDGEHIQTLDYIFYSPDCMRVDSVLEMPTGEQIGENRLPNFNYASDHFSLLADLRLIIWRRKKTLFKCLKKHWKKAFFVYKTKLILITFLPLLK